LAVQPDAIAWQAPWRLLLGLLAIAAAFVLRFILQTILTMACFWSERAAALDRLMLIPYLFLSGLVAPLSTFPPAMRELAAATPFPSMVAFPAALLAGEPVAIGAGFATTAAWCALLLPIALLLWRAGIRRYAAMGA
jgi:ABC-2 type transport system permease protein